MILREAAVKGVISASVGSVVERVAIVSHDAGGAELLAHYVKNANFSACLVLEGPAVNVFHRVLGEVDILPLDQAMEQSTWVLTGSSWQSDLEWRALREAHASHKKCITFLDHWVNYRERFVWNDAECFPDELWVADRYAKSIAENQFPHMQIECKGNPYLDDISKRARLHDADKSANTRPRVLIVTDPISQHATQQFGDPEYHGYTEFDAIDCALRQLPRLLKGGEPEEIIVRPHPSESVEKYQYLIRKYPSMTILVRKQRDLLDELIDSDMVIGCETMALVVAVAAGRRAISCIPRGGRECSLPHSEIEHIVNRLG